LHYRDASEWQKEEGLEQAGYKLVDKVTKELGMLVLADPDSGSSKAKKAREYGIEMISEDELVERMNR